MSPRLSPEIIEAAVAGRGVATADILALKLTRQFGRALTRNSIIGIWNRERGAGRIVDGVVPRLPSLAKAPKSEPATRLARAVPTLPAAAPAKPQAAARPALVPTALTSVLSPTPPAPSRIFAGATGATAAYLDADRGGPTCRWPIGDPRRDGFRFCGEPVTVRTLPSAQGGSRPNVYCEACREKARGQRQPAPVRFGKTAADGFTRAQLMLGRVGGRMAG